MQHGTCKYFNGTWHNEACDLGICYRDVTTDPDRQEGSALRIPCHTPSSKARQDLTPSQAAEFKNRGSCEFFEEPTQEEIAEFEADMRAATERMALTLPLISKVKLAQKGRDWKGAVKCPVCGGSLHLSHAALNGHVWGKCETEDCLAWME